MMNKMAIELATLTEELTIPEMVELSNEQVWAVAGGGESAQRLQVWGPVARAEGAQLV